MDIIDKRYWISSHTVSRYFEIQGNELRKLRKSLEKTDYIRQSTSMMWYFDYDHLKTIHSPKAPIWNDLLFSTNYMPWRRLHIVDDKALAQR